ncbi:MAG: DNA gyrase subunit A [Victivallaceae bacterium]|nr:DNA gyrase subunit A [Victivallaceae bacterium]
MSEIATRDFPVNIEDIMHTAYLQYSLSINVGRAIPDVRDGLKPVNRRILFAMKQQGFTKNHATVKSAKVVGDVIANYHPHGDSSVYDAMVRLAQPFSMRVPLVEGQGNFGSIDGDSAAAYRYTECRLERVSDEMLMDIDKNTVNMTPTFDGTLQEPEVLPARFPQLLVNGTTGIGVGMATSIPPHNLGEVIDATIKLMDDPSATIDDLMELMPGPDFPTGAILRGRYPIRQFYLTGRGSCKVRSRAMIEEKDGKERIIVTEIPYMVNKEQMVRRIAELVTDKVITGISDVRDESSDRTGIRVVIDIKRGAMGSVVLNQLYAHTQMENGYGCTMLVVDNNRPRVMNLIQVLEAYIDHRLEVVTRRTIFDLAKAEARMHILQGLLIALNNIDEVVGIIRGSESRQEASQKLRDRFELSVDQTNAILDMRLHQLTHLAVADLQAEFDELAKFITYCKELLASRERRLQVVKDELIEVRNKYSDPRRTEIISDDSDLNIADLIPRHNCVITVSNTGYIKRVPADTYQTQHRGGKGIKSMETRDEDFVEHLFNANSHDLIFFFTDRGFMYWLNVYEIPEGSRTSKGKAIVNLIKVEPGDRIRAMLTVCKDDFEDENKFIITATRRGYVKKTPLAAFANLRKVGLRALSIEDDDDLIGVDVTGNGDEVVLSTARGLACRFDQSDEEVRPMGRTARGVTGMRFKLEDDYLVSMTVVHENLGGSPAEEEDTAEPAEMDDDAPCIGPEILVVSTNGMGKRSCVTGYRKTRRGAKGVVSIKLREDDKVVSTAQIVPGDQLLVTTERGLLVRIPTDEIRRTGRAAFGVRIMNLNSGDRITGAVRLADAGDAKPDAPDGETNAENGDE